MLRMVSHPRRPQSGHITCYLNRTYHVLPTSLIQLLVGLVVLFKRPRDLTAIAAGIFLCSLGTGNPYFVSPHAGVAWRNLPLVIQWLVFPVLTLGVNGFPSATMLWFAVSFPEPLLRRRWAWLLLTVVTAPLVAVTAAIDYLVLFAAKAPVGDLPGWLSGTTGIAFLAAFLASIVILAVNYFRLQDVNERRRIRLVVFGLLLFVFGNFLQRLFSPFPKRRPGFLRLPLHLWYLVLCRCLSRFVWPMRS